MTIIFEKRKKLQNLFPILGIIILITIIVLWWGFFAKKPPKEPTLPEPPLKPVIKKVEIDFEILKNPQLEKLQLFEKISPYEGEIGRENPFLPY